MDGKEGVGGGGGACYKGVLWEIWWRGGCAGGAVMGEMWGLGDLLKRAGWVFGWGGGGGGGVI